LGTLVPADSEESFVKLFAGQHQAKVDLSLAQALQPFGSRAEYIQIVGSGKDALDFHIAYYMGRLAAEHPGASFIVLSRDTGFDPLIKHLAQQGISCSRVPSLAAKAAPAKTTASKAAAKTATKPAKKAAAKAASKAPAKTSEAAAPEPGAQPKTTAKPAASKQAVADAPAPQVPASRMAEIVKRLLGLKAARPGTVKTLRSSVMAWFKPALTAAQMDEVLEQLQAQGVLRVSGSKVAYSLS